jgi:phospholipid/cholesterol/gamma-HCH transport system substrate-binding protein
MGPTRKAAVGLFVVGGILLFGLALFLIGDRKRLFEDSFVVFAEFEKLAGLQDGALVRVAGLGAGEVLSISYPQSPVAKFRVEMRVTEDLHPLVRKDSVALIQTEGLVGDQIVDIGEGSEGAPPAENGGTIQSRDPFEIADLLTRADELSETLSDTIVSVRDNLGGAIEEVESAARRADALLEDAGDDVTEMTRAGRELTRDVESLVADVRAGKGTVGKLLNDDQLHGEMREVTENLREVTDNASATSENIRRLTEDARGALADFRTKEGGTGGLLADLTRTLASASEAASDLAESTESMKRSFLFRGLFRERGYFDIDALTPQEYVDGVLSKHHRTRRFSISAAELVEVAPSGEEKLSEQGKARIRAIMREVLRYPPDSPLVVEGYANSGPLDQRHLVARRRAALTRDYIVNEFFRSPSYTGFISLESVTPWEIADDEDRDSPESDGVVLALFYDEDVESGSRPRAIH